MVKYVLLLFVLIFGPSIFAQNFCESAAPIPATSPEIDASGSAAVNLFKGVLGKLPPLEAKAQAKAKYAQTQVLAHYPNADKLAIRQQELAYACQILQNSNIAPVKKIAILQSVGEGIEIANQKMTGNEKTRRKPLSSKPTPSAKPQTTTVTPQQGQTGSVNIQGDNNSCIGVGEICPKFYMTSRPAPLVYISPGQLDTEFYHENGSHAIHPFPVYGFGIRVNTYFQDPLFEIAFDNFCAVVEVSLLKNQGMYMNVTNVQHEVKQVTGNNILLHIDVPLNPAQGIGIKCRSDSGQPIKALGAKGLIQDLN